MASTLLTNTKCFASDITLNHSNMTQEELRAWWINETKQSRTEFVNWLCQREEEYEQSN